MPGGEQILGSGYPACFGMGGVAARHGGADTVAAGHALAAHINGGTQNYAEIETEEETF